MKILLTGGAGFIGAHVAKELLARGDQVAIVDNFNNYYSPNLKTARLDSLLKGKKYQLYKTDICDFSDLEKVFLKEKPTTVIHLAAMAGVRASLLNPSLYQKVNIEGTLNVLELAKKNGVEKLVYASSSSVYGGSRERSFREKQETDQPLSIYAATKKATELLAGVYRRVHNLKATGIRYFTVYGPWGRPDMAYYQFADKITTGSPIAVYSRGKVSRDFTYIDDAVSGTIKILDAKASLPVVNLGGEKPTAVKEMVALLELYLGKKAVVSFAKLPVTDSERTSANIGLARHLGWEPQVEFPEGIKRFAEWYQSTGAKIKI
jgi:UDP-glucuronate 4-epimerase